MAAAAASAIVALAAWPYATARHAADVEAAAIGTPAPVRRDDLTRDKQIAFFERAAALRHKNDMMIPRMLASEYVQRYRERGDIDDLLRALAMTRRSHRVMPRGNDAADLTEASALLALHRFREARDDVRRVEADRPGEAALLARDAALSMELGELSTAHALLRRAAQAKAGDVDVIVTQARYDELTGRIATARAEIERPAALLDRNGDASAQARAWFHVREGQLAFAAGDVDAAIMHGREALALHPDDYEALGALAKFEWGARYWTDALADARRAAAIVPYPETLGYEADAERELGNAAAAKRTDALIGAIARLGNAQHVTDRMIAIYWAQHGEEPARALKIARDELKLRDDPFTEDAIAEAALAAGDLSTARRASAKALASGSEDAAMHYHAGMIALRSGDRATAKRELAAALTRNPFFDPYGSVAARALLAKL